MATEIILGSSSKYRAQALTTLGLTFSQQSPDIDETAQPEELPDALACRLALAKAKVIAQRNPGKIVLGSDQTGACDNRILENQEASRQQLSQYVIAAANWQPSIPA